MSRISYTQTTQFKDYIICRQLVFVLLLFRNGEEKVKHKKTILEMEDPCLLEGVLHFMV